MRKWPPSQFGDLERRVKEMEATARRESGCPELVFELRSVSHTLFNVRLACPREPPASFDEGLAHQPGPQRVKAL